MLVIFYTENTINSNNVIRIHYSVKLSEFTQQDLERKHYAIEATRIGL